MDVFMILLYVILFLLLMVFIFSVAVLSPYLDKKDLVGILAIGFILGAIGGVFFISPVYDEFPALIGTVDAMITGQDEYINVDVGSQADNNITDMENNIKKVPGVKGVTTSGIMIMTSNFSSNYSDYIKDSIMHNINQSSHVKDVKINSEQGIINVTVKNDTDPIAMKDDLEEFLSESYALYALSTTFRLQAHVNVNDVDTVEENMKEAGIPFSTVEGPVETFVEKSKNTMPPLWAAYIISGIIGIIFAILGMFVDKIYYGWKNTVRSRKSAKSSKTDIDSYAKFTKGFDVNKYKKKEDNIKDSDDKDSDDDKESKSDDKNSEIVENGNIHIVEDIPKEIEDKKSKINNLKEDKEKKVINELKKESKVEDVSDKSKKDNHKNSNKTLDDFENKKD
ncbi:hypothetical protein BGI41_07335 [Methanobrevibacter sp. 87.7]|uniref:hypothetical protein n=1 Tax=Methanobrevibacter sp. 87.7 TaxID=387957 RepID=UPI000B5001F9|nr:hypothetical protein [Methanobrevibacter sp. 87.7]OWT32503.1 hypothetical protein BGI41_07335 [Methanobrevibacter sp. 87.7]